MQHDQAPHQPLSLGADSTQAPTYSELVYALRRIHYWVGLTSGTQAVLLACGVDHPHVQLAEIVRRFPDAEYIETAERG